MTIFEEDAPPPVKKLLVPPALDRLSVDELQAYIGDLDGEIARVKQAIAGKQAHAAAAAMFFKPKPEE